MSSLSTAETPLRGLTDGELVESLVDPLLEVSEIKTALSRLQGQAWYLFLGSTRGSSSARQRTSRPKSPKLQRILPKSKWIRRSETSCRKYSSLAARRSMQIEWRSYLPSMKSISTMTDRRLSFLSDPPMRSLRISTIGGNDRISRTAFWSSLPIRTRSRPSAPAPGACELSRGWSSASVYNTATRLRKCRNFRREGARGCRLHERAAGNLQDHRLPDRKGAPPRWRLSDGIRRKRLFRRATDRRYAF